MNNTTSPWGRLNRRAKKGVLGTKLINKLINKCVGENRVLIEINRMYYLIEFINYINNITSRWVFLSYPLSTLYLS